GTFIEDGPTALILERPQHRYTQALLEAALHIEDR
ncbi:MAG: dipeptide/oligopeptide/nickel ABC transporter ATP-binding protein, partial [Acidobacteria bacterium]|nr:dipeptide/oligopeptide/nickel ABC transporter ATP-binding protein [Candidatus Sulfomarinibacter kjeldsenii]